MAIDTAQKRMSVLNNTSPWRGVLVDATESSFSVGNRMAALFLYAGIAAASASGPDYASAEWTLSQGRLHFSFDEERAHWTVTDGPLHWTFEA